jgi:hypothetical protein
MSKQPENVEYFGSLDSTITNHARRLGLIKEMFSEKNSHFARGIELNLKN